MEVNVSRRSTIADYMQKPCTINMIMSLSVLIKITEYVNLSACLPDTHINGQQRPTEYGSV